MQIAFGRRRALWRKGGRSGRQLGNLQANGLLVAARDGRREVDGKAHDGYLLSSLYLGVLVITM